MTWRSRACSSAAVVLTLAAVSLEAHAAGGGERAIDDAALAARVSGAAAATEYWDVTARLEAGYRLFARFLITNEGPGSRTAAAAGHLILPDRTVVPIKFGRLREAWTLSDDRRRLKVASAVLDLSGPASFVEVDSDKHGIKLRLDFPREDAPAFAVPQVDGYGIAVLTPVPARGAVQLRGMAESVPLSGTLALTHTWMERGEGDMLQRRADVSGRSGTVGFYFAALTRQDGSQGGVLLVRDGPRVVHRSNAVPWVFGEQRTTPGDSRYPVAQRWEVQDTVAHLTAELEREWLRWDPLDIVPQPFRFLLGLRVQPQRMWADAAVTLTLAPRVTNGAEKLDATGVAEVSFARPLRR